MPVNGVKLLLKLLQHTTHIVNQLTSLQNDIKSLKDILQHYLFIDLTDSTSVPIKFHISNNLRQYEKQILNQLLDDMATVDDAAKLLETNILPLVATQQDSQTIAYFNKKVEQIVCSVWNYLLANTTVHTLDGDYRLSPKDFTSIQIIDLVSSKKLITNNQLLII